MRNNRHSPIPDAGAAADLATAESRFDGRERPRLSEDRCWWWDGRRWLPTVTADGLWHWDGTRWQPTVPLSGVRPWDRAATLSLLAEDRYARASVILVQRAREWQPGAGLRGLVEKAARDRARLLRMSRTLAALSGGPGPGAWVRRRVAKRQDREQVAEGRALLDTNYRTLMVQIGRSAPRPTVKEADDLLESARALDDRAARLTEALSAVDRAERARARRIERAQRALAAAEERRRIALAEARRRIDEVRERQPGRQARERLRAALTPAPGAAVGEAGPIRLLETVVETPWGRLPAEAVRADVGSAADLWAGHRDLLLDLLALETPEARAFADALTERSADLFLFLQGRSRSVLWPCAAGDQEAARALASAVVQNAPRARGRASGRVRSARAAEAELADVASTSAAARAEAEAELAGVEADASLSAAIREAREALEAARRDPSDLVEARSRIASEMRVLVTPPAPLATPAVRTVGSAAT